MIKKVYFLFPLLLIVVVSFAQVSLPRTKYNFNSDWKVFVGDDKEASGSSFNDASWKKVTLPYVWNEDDAFKKDIADHTTGIAWYRKHFKLPAAAKGQKVFLEFACYGRWQGSIQWNNPNFAWLFYYWL